MINSLYLKKKKILKSGKNSEKNSENINTNNNNLNERFNPDVSIKYNKLLNNRYEFNKILTQNQEKVEKESILPTTKILKKSIDQDIIENNILDKKLQEHINDREVMENILNKKYIKNNNFKKMLNDESQKIENENKNINDFLDLKDENKKYYQQIQTEIKDSIKKKDEIYCELKNLGIL